MKTVAIIPARRGSKRIPNKNLETIGGRSLVQIAIECAMKIDEIVDIIVTTDDATVAHDARERGTIVVDRPSDLCGDDVLTESVIRHALEWTRTVFDAVLVLQPTSPLRNATDIRLVMTKFERLSADAVLTVTPAKPNECFNMTKMHQELREACPQVLVPNGAIYCLRPSSVIAEAWYRGAIYGYEMDPERSIDIDTESDLRRVRAIMEAK